MRVALRGWRSIRGRVRLDSGRGTLGRFGPLREARLILPGVYASDNQNLFELALNAGLPSASFRVYQGYAGWMSGQLERELAAGLWTVAAASPQIVFDPDPATLWQRLQAPAATPHPPSPALVR